MNIDFDSDTQTVRVDGARISLDVLATLAKPEALRYYRFVRVGETIFISSYSQIRDHQMEQREAFTSGIKTTDREKPQGDRYD